MSSQFTLSPLIEPHTLIGADESRHTILPASNVIMRVMHHRLYDRNLLLVKQAAGVMSVYVSILDKEGRLHQERAMNYM